MPESFALFSETENELQDLVCSLKQHAYELVYGKLEGVDLWLYRRKDSNQVRPAEGMSIFILKKSCDQIWWPNHINRLLDLEFSAKQKCRVNKQQEEELEFNLGW